MAGQKKKARPVAPATPQGQSPTKTSTLVTDPNLGFRIRALLYDFRNFRTDQASRDRLSLTTNPLYISSPHFTPDEAARIRAAIVDTYTEMSKDPHAENYEVEDDETPTLTPTPTSEPQSVEHMLHATFARFLEKRRASGDSRPCGPHDMAPVYEAIFGVSRADLEEANFLRRLRKSGLRIDHEQNKPAGDVDTKKKRGGR
ncbi:putative C6 transcription factor [Hypoxylon sp. FL1150]|nr:putative C6 transcription factor [Hypoxylon sp. FL1150]